METRNTKEEHAALLFPGGRDSSLAACLIAQRGVLVHLITTFNGAVVKGDISNYRYEELRSVFHYHIVERVTIPSYSLFRRVALADIEKDFAKYKKNLIPVGDGLASECVNNFETPVAGSLVSNAALPRVHAAWVLEG
ncbi:MAG: hypothetical protein ACREV1_06995 [Gammaproteobacteria bacterium]